MCDFKNESGKWGTWEKANHFFDFQGEKGLWEIQFSFMILNCTFFIKYAITKKY